MATKTEEVQARIEEILAASGYPYAVEDGRARIERGSTAVFIAAREWQDRHVIVELVCPMLGDVDRSAELLDKLNELNAGLYVGKAYWRNREVWLAHNLLGDFLDAEELLASVGMMAVVADKIDDELQQRYGGRRWRDLTAKK